MGSLTHTRCFNHGQREAAARCPSCRRHYCRECVTEHEHRLLCAACIRAASGPGDAAPRMRLALWPPIQLCAALVGLWIVFYALGQALLLVPSEFHDRRMGFFEGLDAAAPPDDEGTAP